MEAQKRFRLAGRVRPTRQRQESDGVDYDLDSFDSLEDAEAARRERWRVGWGSIEIIDLHANAPLKPSPSPSATHRPRM
jgi:hypothetical protein